MIENLPGHSLYLRASHDLTEIKLKNMMQHEHKTELFKGLFLKKTIVKLSLTAVLFVLFPCLIQDLKSVHARHGFLP